MIPHISPGKTWEGLAGAFLGAFLAAHGMVALFGSKLIYIDHFHAAGLAVFLGAITVVADLRSRVTRTIALLDALTPDTLAGAERRHITVPLRTRTLWPDRLMADIGGGGLRAARSVLSVL